MRTQKTYVIGHLNPDTDTIASAMGYAWLLSFDLEGEVIPARAGTMNKQTTWAVERMGLEAPFLLTDVSPQIENVTRLLDTVLPDAPLSDAWAIVNRTGTVAPVVSEDGRPIGLVTGLSLFAMLNQMVGPRPGRQEVKLTELFSHPCIEAADTDVPVFQSNSRIRERLPRVLRDERDDFWVVDKEGRYAGICRKPDLLNPPRTQLVLVDHNEVDQAIASLDEAVLLEVLDHHRLSNPPTKLPIRFHIDPVGSTSTLVSERIEDAGMRAIPPLAGMLLAGLVSDTLMLQSPTTTERDKEAVERLSRWAFVGGSPLAGETFESFGKALLQAGAGISTRDPSDVVSGDLKTYEARSMHFGVAQVEVVDAREITENLNVLVTALNELCEKRSLEFSVLMVTDIINGSSRLLLGGNSSLLADLQYPRLPDDTLDAQGVVSRKKQLLPALLSFLEA